jgi:hypothetical protein
VEISLVRQRLLMASARARERAQQRRTRADRAAEAFETFLREVAAPVTKQLASALKAEGQAFTVFTPGDGLRLASDRSRDDYVEFALAVGDEGSHVVVRTSRTRGSRTILEERPVKDSSDPAELTEDDVLSVLLEALEPWLER